MAQLSHTSRSPVWSVRPMSWLLPLLLLLCCELPKAGGDIAVQVLSNSTGFLGGSTVLHCSLASKENVTVTQVTWMKWNPDGSHPSVAVFHPKKGPSISEPERVKFLVAKVYEDLRNASLAISNLRVEDEGIYECQIATFPTGSKSANVWLKMFARPKNTAEALEPSPTTSMLPDVAKCISADGHPPGRITWSENVNGSHRETKETGSQPGTTTVISYFSMVPSSQADGKNITCTVAHESFQEPDQLPLILSLLYPPEVSISGYDGNWDVGLTDVTLTCEARSKPPSNYSWSTATGLFPNSANPKDNQLLISTVDKDLNNTIFVCKATNALGSGQDQVTILVKEASEILPQNTSTGYVIAIIVILVILLVVLCVIGGALWKRRRGGRQQSRTLDNENVHYSAVNGGSVQNKETNNSR